MGGFAREREREADGERERARKKKEKKSGPRRSEREREGKSLLTQERKMPPRRRRSRSRGAAQHLEEERSIIAVDVADGHLVAREYPKSAEALPSSLPDRQTRRSPALSLPPRPWRRRPSLAALASALGAAAASALLPAGYPDSVTSDYLSFQVFDSLQGLCSYVRGVVSASAVLSGLGVGQQQQQQRQGASPGASSALAAAATINAARDAVGMVAGFFLAAAAAPGMDADAKRWRLAADVSNDLSLALEVVAAPLASAAAALWFRSRGGEEGEGSKGSLFFSSFFRSPFSSSSAAAPPPPSDGGGGEQRLRAVLFALVVCLAAAARALTGVAGGATRAALTAHFCRGSGRKEAEEGEEEEGEEESTTSGRKRRSNEKRPGAGSNAGDVAAKEGSQEAACTLVGMLLGLLLTRASAANPRLGALAFALLTVAHVYFNARALRCLRLTSLNRARLELVVAEMAASSGGERVLTPADAAALEPLWPPPFLSFSPRRRNRVVMGASLGEVAEAAGTSVEELLLLPPRRSEEEEEQDDGENASSSSSTPLPFVAAFCPKTKRSLVALRSDCSPSDEVAAFVLGLLLCGIGKGGEQRPRGRGEAEGWLRRRWFGGPGRTTEDRRGRKESNGAREKRATATKPLAELLLERAGWDPIGRCGISLGAQKSNLRYELLGEGRREKCE